MQFKQDAHKTQQFSNTQYSNQQQQTSHQHYHNHNGTFHKKFQPGVRFQYRNRIGHFDRRKRRPFCCVNCGKEGHVYKECQEPITSFGIIAMCKHRVIPQLQDEHVSMEKRYVCNKHSKESSDFIEKEIESDVYYLMVQRKDTMGFIDFLRGKYPEDNEEKKEEMLRQYLHEMTCAERRDLGILDFTDLWDNLWVNKYSMLYLNEYMEAKRKFSQIEVHRLLTETECQWTEQEYGFPKGRKNMYETNIECAKREFREESGYTADQIRILSEKPWEEVFTGTNGIRYRHVYYLAEILPGQENPKIPLEDIRQAGEISSYGWFPFEQCMNIIRPYDVAKKELLNRIHSIMKEIRQN